MGELLSRPPHVSLDPQAGLDIRHASTLAGQTSQDQDAVGGEEKAGDLQVEMQDGHLCQQKGVGTALCSYTAPHSAATGEPLSKVKLLKLRNI